MGCGSSQVAPGTSTDQRPTQKPETNTNGAIKRGNNKPVSSTDSNANRSDSVTNNPGKSITGALWKHGSDH